MKYPLRIWFYCLSEHIRIISYFICGFLYSFQQLLLGCCWPLIHKSLIYPHKFNSNDLGGQATGPPKPIEFPQKRAFNHIARFLLYEAVHRRAGTLTQMCLFFLRKRLVFYQSKIGLSKGFLSRLSEKVLCQKTRDCEKVDFPNCLRDLRRIPTDRTPSFVRNLIIIRCVADG